MTKSRERVQERKDRQISYEAIVEDTGDSVRNGTAAQCGNRDSESKILCGNSLFYDPCADGILAGYAAASGSVSAGVFYKTQSVFGSCNFCDRVCCGNYQQCASGVPDNAVYRGGSSSDEICCNTSDNLSDLVADYSDGSGRCGSYPFLRSALAKGTGGSAESKPYGVRLCGCCNHAGNLGNVEFFSCLRPCCTSFWKHRPGLQGLWSGVLFCQLFVEYRD